MQFGLVYFVSVWLSLVEFQLVLFNFISFIESEAHSGGLGYTVGPLEALSNLMLSVLFAPKQMHLDWFSLAWPKANAI